MVRADRGRENIWASSDNAGVFEKTTEMAGGCRGGSMKCSMFKRKVVEAEILLVFFRVVKGDAEFKIFHSMLKYNDFFVAQNLSGNVMRSWGVVHWEGFRGYSRYHGTSHGRGRRLNS